MSLLRDRSNPQRFETAAWKPRVDVTVPTSSVYTVRAEEKRENCIHLNLLGFLKCTWLTVDTFSHFSCLMKWKDECSSRWCQQVWFRSFTLQYLIFFVVSCFVGAPFQFSSAEYWAMMRLWSTVCLYSKWMCNPPGTLYQISRWMFFLGSCPWKRMLNGLKRLCQSIQSCCWTIWTAGVVLGPVGASGINLQKSGHTELLIIHA